MGKLGDSGGTNSLIEKLKEKKLDEELYKTKCNSQEITYDYFKGLKEREKLQEENNKLQEEEKSEVPLSSSKSSSSKSSEDSKENTENNQIDTLSSLNSSGNWQVKLLNADVLNPHIIMSKILLCEEYCEVERFPNATLTCFEVNENRAELIKQFCQFIIKRFAMMNNENTEHLGIKFIIQIANLKRHKMREWRNNEIRIRTNPLVISPQIQNANPINLIFFLEHTPLNLEFYNLFSISDTFQNEDSYCPVKYWRSIDDEMGNIDNVRKTYQCQEINNQMYSNNSWIVLLKAIHSYIESLSNPEDDQPQCIEFPKYWDFIKGMDGIHVHNTLSEVVMVNERLEVMDEIRYSFNENINYILKANLTSQI